MLIDRANLMLDAWEDQVITDDETRSRAERELVAIADAASTPTWLLDLVQFGPRAVADRGHEWRRPSDFRLRFAMRAARLDLAHRSSVEAFARWLARAAMGRDLDQPEVQLGYQVDDCLGDRDRIDLAVQCVREELPQLMDRCRSDLASHFR